jgi:hypothetical protein
MWCNIYYYTIFTGGLMRFCKNCNAHIPNKIRIDGKQYTLNRRKYCIECSPIGAKQGYVLRRLETYKRKNVINGKKTCVICPKSFNTSTKNSVCPTCRMRYRSHKTKTKYLLLKGGKCKNCGESDLSCLVFHHKNPKEKSFTLSQNWSCCKEELIQKEVEKCEILCSNCHSKLHKEEDEELKNILKHYERASGGTGDTRQS